MSLLRILTSLPAMVEFQLAQTVGRKAITRLGVLIQLQLLHQNVLEVAHGKNRFEMAYLLFRMALFTDIWCLFNVGRVFKLAAGSFSRIITNPTFSIITRSITNSTFSVITRSITMTVWVLHITMCRCGLHVYAMLMGNSFCKLFFLDHFFL